MNQATWQLLMSLIPFSVLAVLALFEFLNEKTIFEIMLSHLKQFRSELQNQDQRLKSRIEDALSREFKIQKKKFKFDVELPKGISLNQGVSNANS